MKISSWLRERRIKHLFRKTDVPEVHGETEIMRSLEEKGLNRNEAQSTVVSMLIKESQKLHNKEAVEQKANTIEGFKEEDKKKVDKDWLTRFYSIAEDVSDETMQNLWAQILAGEVKRPKSYSLRTLDFLRLLSPEEAKLFAESAKYVCFRNVVLVEDGYGLPFYQQMSLVDSQLIMAEDLVKTLTIMPNRVNVAKFDSKHIMEILSNKSDEIKIQFKVRKLTKVAEELLSLIDVEDNAELYDFVANKIKDSGISRVSLHDIISDNGDGTYKYVETPIKEY